MHWQMKKITRGMVNGVWIAGFLNSGCFFFFLFCYFVSFSEVFVGGWQMKVTSAEVTPKRHPLKKCHDNSGRWDDFQAYLGK